MAGNGGPAGQTGCAVHIYAANQSMSGRFFANADGEMLILPQLGKLRFFTELGILEVAPGEICVLPRGLKMRVELLEDSARGYICENYGLPFRLPDLGPIGANGLANPRDFLSPVAAFEDVDGDFQSLCKFQGKLWSAGIDHSPLDVVGWHGNYAPYKYDMANFNCINRSASTIRTPRSIPCSRRPPRCRAQAMSTLAFSLRAGWWPSTPFARPGSTATR